jgi:predicted Zn finger-like uncharacterized protein
MIEIQCTSCLTRYRIEPSVLPAEKPTFKCSRCGHVFSADPRRAKSVSSAAPVFKRTLSDTPSKPAAAEPPPPPAQPKSAAQPPPPPVQPQPAAPEPSVETRAPSNVEARTTSGSETHNPLARSFADHDDGKPGENLSFDFADDFGPASEPVAPPSEPVKETRWQVGSFDPILQDNFSPGPSEIADPNETPRDTSDLNNPYGDAVTRPVDYPSAAPAQARDRDRDRVHSSGFFLIVFVALLASFTAVSVMISNQAAASLYLLGHVPGLADYFNTPAAPVALHQPHAEYQRLKDGQAALIVSGDAENVGQNPLHAVQIAIDLVDSSQRALARQAVYCGNQISPRMTADMTPRELEFFGKLEPPRSFVITPGGSSSFVAIFIDPPEKSHSFRIAVVDAREPERSGAPHN